MPANSIPLADWQRELYAAGSDLPKELLDAVTFGENPGARRSGTITTDLTSPKGARGPGQIMPATQQGLERLGAVQPGLNPTNASDAATLTAATLRESLRRTGDVRATLAEYNGGSAARRAVERGEEPPAAETRRYMMNLDGGVTPGAGQTVNESYRSGGSERIRDPLYVDKMLSELAAHSAVNAQLTNSLAENTKQAVENLGQVAEAQTKAGTAGAAAIRAQGEQEVAQNQQSENIRIAMGAMVLDPESRIAQANRTIAQAQTEQDALRPQIEAKASVRFLDDPLGFIVNQIELPGMKRQYNAARDNEILNTQRIAQIQDSTAKQIMYDVPNVITTVQAKTAAMAEEKQAASLAAAAQARAQSFNMQAALVTQQLANSNTSSNMRISVYGKLMDLGTFNEQMGERTAEQKKLLADVNPFNVKMAAIGANMYSPEAWKDQKPDQRQAARTLGSMVAGYGGDMGETLQNLDRFNIGAQFAAAPITGEAFKLLRSVPNSPTFLKIQTEATNPASPKANRKLLGLPPDQQRYELMTMVHAKWVDDVTRKPDGTYAAGAHNLLNEDNPYRLDTRYAVSVPELKDNLLAKYAKDQLAVNSLNPPKDNAMAQHALSLALADPANVRKYAEQTAAFFRAAVNKQYEAKQLAMVGFPRIEDYAMSGLDSNQEKPRKVQMLNPADVENWMMRQITSAKAKAASMSLGSILFNPDSALTGAYQ